MSQQHPPPALGSSPARQPLGGGKPAPATTHVAGHGQTPPAQPPSPTPTPAPSQPPTRARTRTQSSKFKLGLRLAAAAMALVLGILGVTWLLSNSEQPELIGSAVFQSDVFQGLRSTEDGITSWTPSRDGTGYTGTFSVPLNLDPNAEHFAVLSIRNLPADGSTDLFKVSPNCLKDWQIPHQGVWHTRTGCHETMLHGFVDTL